MMHADDAKSKSRREKGTYTCLDNSFLEEHLKAIPCTQGILLYLQMKRNYDQDGASLGELLDALGCAPGTLENTLYRLVSAGEIQRTEGRYYPSSTDVSTTSSTGTSTDVSTKLWKTEPEKPVQDGAPEPLKEEKEIEGIEGSKTPPPNPPKGGEGKKRFSPLEVDLPVCVSPDIWAEWVQHRREIKKPLKATSVKQQLTLLEKHPHDADTMLLQSIRNGWTGVFEVKTDRAGGAKCSARAAPPGMSRADQKLAENAAAIWAAIGGDDD